MALPSPSHGMSWPLVGREDELRRIAELRDAEATGVVLHAPAGVGKSRLAREALARAAAEGAHTAWVQATRSAATVPLAAFAGILPPEARSDDRLELMRRGVAALRERAGSGRLVLGVDDAQLLDPTSAALVLHLATSGAVFVVVTVRRGEPCPDAIVSLWKDAGAPRLELDTLGEAETALVAETMLGGPLDHRARRWIWDVTQGNALFVRELVTGAAENGSLESVPGLWRLRDRPKVGGSLADLVEARLRDLPAEEHRVLELLALGEPLRVNELIALAGSERVGALDERGLIAVAGDNASIVHPLYGEAIRARLPVLRAHELRLRLADTLRARDDVGPDDALRIARWLLDAGMPIPRDLTVTAARAANLSGDPELGEELGRRAVADGAGVEAALVLARSYAVRNLFAEAAEVLAAAESSVATEDEALAFLDASASVLHWGLQRTDDLRRLVARAEGWWPTVTWRRRLAPVRLSTTAFLSDEGPGVVAAEAETLLEDEDLEPTVRRRVEVVLLRALFWGGRGREAYALGLRLRPALPWRDMADESTAAVWAGIGAETGEGWAELDAWATATLTEAVRVDDTGAAGVTALALGNLRFAAGRYEDARRWLTEAEAHQERHDPIGLRTVSSALQAGVACALGDAEGAAAALARCRATMRGDEPGPLQLPYLAVAEAWAVAAEGDLPAAHGLLLAAVDRVRSTPLYAGRLAYEAMRLGAPARAVAPVLAELRAEADASLLDAQADHAGARARRDAAALLASAEAFAAIGAQRFACEAAAHAAEAFADAGRQDSARRAAARSAELFVAGQGAQMPAIAGVGAEQVALTPREQQLVGLAAQGLSNAEIAERLVLSVRTVESHLYRAMQKLGIGDRRDLAGLRVTPLRGG